MKPLPAASRVLEVNGLLVTDMTFESVQYSCEHDHELPFVGVILDGGLEKWLGRLSFSVSTAGAYVMPAGVRHIDGFPVGVRLLTIELDPATEIWESPARACWPGYAVCAGPSWRRSRGRSPWSCGLRPISDRSRWRG